MAIERLHLVTTISIEGRHSDNNIAFPPGVLAFLALEGILPLHGSAHSLLGIGGPVSEFHWLFDPHNLVSENNLEPGTGKIASRVTITDFLVFAALILTISASY